MSTVRDTWSLACPRCGADHEIDIAATVWARLCPDGTDVTLAANGDHEWSEHSGAICRACGHGANVSDFASREGSPS